MSKADLSAVVDLSKYIDLKVRVKFQGGREVEGLLKGFDKLDNLVLDDAIEFLRGTVLHFLSILPLPVFS